MIMSQSIDLAGLSHRKNSLTLPCFLTWNSHQSDKISAPYPPTFDMQKKEANNPQLGLGLSSLLTPSNMPSPLFFCFFSGYTGSNTRMPMFKKKLSGHLSAKSHRYEGLEEWNMDTCDKFIRKSIYINDNILKNILD